MFTLFSPRYTIKVEELAIWFFMESDFIDYGQLIDDAMHVIVKEALKRVSTSGLPGKHHFFISFLTNHEDVEISDRLKEKYPDEMTIVLQYQFEDLTVTDDFVSVVLSFDNIKEKIVIPFDALTAFADPSVKFGLQFRRVDSSYEASPKDDENIPEKVKSTKRTKASTKTNRPATKKARSKKTAASSKKDSNVIKLDNFRKK